MLRDEMREHLCGRLIPFWEKLRDGEFGGYYGFVDSGLRTDVRAVKGCILNSRILWFFSNAYMCLCGLPAGEEGRGQVRLEALRENADWAYRFLREHCLDREKGGVYWSVDYRGEPEDATKHTYNQAFAVYALSSYFRAFHAPDALKLAEELVEVMETRCFDSHGYREALDRDFHPVPNHKLSENGVMADRTMNTLLHVMEAYTEYLLARREDGGAAAVDHAGTQAVSSKLRWMLELVAEKVYHPGLHRQEVFFDQDMNSLIDLHSYGHDIEAAWLMDRCLEVLGDRELAEHMGPMLRSLEREVYEKAYSGGSLANECEGGRVDQRRIWWVQAEGVVGFFNAYQRTGDSRYLDASREIWRFIQDCLVDKREGGEWFWYTDREGIPAADKPVVEPWKCPYHNGRMCMEIIRREGLMEKNEDRGPASRRDRGRGGAGLHPGYGEELARQRALLERPNEADPSFYNGIFTRYRYPVLTREHIPLFWRYDLNKETNPFFQERLGINAVMNAGAVELNGKLCLVARVEGNDRKSFFAVAESDTGIDGFRFRDYPVVLPDTCPEETNVYDMRLTKHEDGYIYGVFCSESKDTSSGDLSAAVAAAGIVRTKDLVVWERLPNLRTLRSPQQRNVVLHPEFVEGKYAFYTRPMDSFIDTGSGGGIGFGLCDDILHPVIDEERITSRRRYHTVTEAKNGAGAVPIKTPKGWIHIAHGVRNTAAGLRYVIYAFATALEDPARVIAEPGGLLIGPRGDERTGDVSNVVFTNGVIARENGDVFIYYASSDTRVHVAVTTVERLTDYVFNTPPDPLRSADCVALRCSLIERNLALLGK